MFGYTMYHKPSFEFCHGIFRKKIHFLLIYYMETSVSGMHQRIEGCLKIDIKKQLPTGIWTIY